ncbi:MAG: hypothetical protein U0401_27835 [Anaerolineae bacterium]
MPFGADPIAAYSTMLRDSFGSWRGFGFTLVNATPLIFVGLGTIFAWRSVSFTWVLKGRC